MKIIYNKHKFLYSYRGLLQKKTLNLTPSPYFKNLDTGLMQQNVIPFLYIMKTSLNAMHFIRIISQIEQLNRRKNWLEEYSFDLFLTFWGKKSCKKITSIIIIARKE